jgi:hypothetical protein
MQSVVSSDSILLAGRADKFFVSHWTVAGTRIDTKREDFVQELLRTSITNPVYYYYIPADSNSHKTKAALEKAGVSLKYVTMFFEGETLYQLDWPNK